MTSLQGPELALAASAREWPERLHRFLLDHGGGRVRTRVMGPDQATSDEYDLILIDDVCSFLNQRLVKTLRDRGREVVGVYNPEDGPDAKRYLLDCGITDVIEGDASPEEFLAIVLSTLKHRGQVDRPARIGKASRTLTLAVVAASGGVGVTEVALGVAHSLAGNKRALLVDLDQKSPGLAQRLDLPLHPNLLTAIDLAHHSMSRLREAVLVMGELSVIGGLARFDDQTRVAPMEIRGLLDELSSLDFDALVVDLGEIDRDQIGVIAPDIVVVVGTGQPVGITRLVRKVRGLEALSGSMDLLAVANKVPGGSRKSLEIRSEWFSTLPDIPLLLIPQDGRVDRAAWDGDVPTRGPFSKSVGSIARLVSEALE